MSVNEIRSIDLFVKTVESGSIRGAAAVLGISAQAASKSLAALEQRLGVRLLHRTTRGIALTSEGQQFLEGAQPALAALERAIDSVRISKDEIAGPLRIVAPRYGFRSLLWPLIDEFCRLHPAIEPHLKLDDRLGDWALDRADVGFRIGSAPQDGVTARRLLPIQLIVCAAPSYVEAHGAPTSIDQLASHRCSVLRHSTTGRVLPWLLKKDGEVISLDLRPSLSTNDAGLEIEAVLSGHAIGLLANFSVAPLIRSRRLIPLLTAHVADHLGLYVYYGSRAAQPSRVRSFIDLVVERLGQSSEHVLDRHALVTAQARSNPKTRGGGQQP